MNELSEAGRVAAASSLYSSEPVGFANQPPFVNAVVKLETELEAEPLLDFLLALERRYGRQRTRDVPKGPRSLDLDLLLMDELVMRSPRLTLPHPELDQRRFVLEPLSQIAPELRHPVSGATMRELLAVLPEEGANRSSAVRRLSSQTRTS